MVLDLLFDIAAAWTLAEGAYVVRGGISTKEENNFDEKNGAIGINPRDVVKITQRNGLYPNKYDVIPAEPNCRIMKYVAQYANKPSDIEEFKRQWHFPKNKNMGKYEFKELYKQCCAYLGYDVML